MGWNSAQYSSNSQPWPGVVGKVELESRCTQVTEPSSMLTARLYMEPQGDEAWGILPPPKMQALQDKEGATQVEALPLASQGS
jgi:hypothetical protein